MNPAIKYNICFNTSVIFYRVAVARFEDTSNMEGKMKITVSRLVMMVSVLALLGLSGCSLTMIKEMGPRPAREDATIPAGVSPIRYDIQVRYFNQNNIGITQSIDEIASTVSHYRLKDGGHVYRWDDYRFRHIELDKADPPIENGMDYDRISADGDMAWQTMEEVIGHTYYVEDSIAKDGQLTLLPHTDFVRRDNDGFRYYLNIIDFHMWDIYAQLVAKLKEKGDEFKANEEEHVIDILRWENVADHAEMEGGTIYARLLGDSQYHGQASKQYYFQQNQRLRMEVYAPFAMGLAFRMPYTGSNRFMGVFELDAKRQLVDGRFNEYVYGSVKAPFFINALTYHKREYIVTRVE